METRFVDNKEADRFELWEGDERIGYLTYHVDHSADGDVITMPHTVVDPRFGGRGHGTRLVVHALDTAREAGQRVVPQCSFIRAYVDDHPEYADIVAS